MVLHSADSVRTESRPLPWAIFIIITRVIALVPAKAVGIFFIYGRCSYVKDRIE